MESVEWDFDAQVLRPALESFGENQVGAVTLPVEPVAGGSALSWVAAQFQAEPEAASLPVERDGGVVGLVSRSRVQERTGKFFDGLSGKSLDQDLTPHGVLDARESIDKVVAGLFRETSAALVEHFLVYLGGKYYGVTDLRRLVSRSATLRDQDIGKAREVQERALARSRLPATSWSRARLVRMAYGVGGDFYQELAWPDGTCLMGCFDVAGKGLSGSLVTSALGGFFGALRAAQGGAPPPEVLATRLNEFLMEILPLGTYVTAVLFVLPAKAGPEAPLRILNFGYGPVYFYQRAEDRVVGRGLKPNLAPLGLEAVTYGAKDVYALPLEAGTKVYLLSDGLPDLMNPLGERYGDENLRAFLSKHYKENPEGFLNLLQAEIQDWQKDAPQADDITALVIQA